SQKRTLVLGLFLICTTLLIFTGMVGDSLCKLHYRKEKTGRAVGLAKEEKRWGGGGGSFPRLSRVVEPQRTLINGPLFAGHCL
ncbi:Hok/Gef family protein, partial [Enterobacter kobei]|uniref:Hok/Gef family protein n=1 Tax=Enterobacter kobei TaxID=208224 RepID=UPI002FF985FB